MSGGTESSFGGLWKYSCPRHPEHDEFIFVDEARGRVFAFVVALVDPIRRAPMRNWFRLDSPTAISLKMHYADPWHMLEIRLSDDELYWNWETGSTTSRRVASDQFPAWLERELAKAHARMDAEEAAASTS